MIYVVLGMHKSGTSLVSELLHRSGVRMVDVDAEPGDYDAGAFYERADVRELNCEILGFGDPAYLHPKPAALRLRDDLRVRMRAILQRCEAAGGDWGFKDPRTCLTYPLWREELGAHRIVAVTRSLGEVLSHYRKREPKWLLTWRTVRTWCDYNEGMLRALQAQESEALLLSYEALMTSQEELERLERFVGRKIADVRSPSHYRSQGGFRLSTAAVVALRALAGQSRPAAITRGLDALREEQRRP